LARTSVGINAAEAIRGVATALMVTDSNGRYAIRGLTPGSYQVSAGVFSPYYTTQVFPNLDCLQGACGQGTPIVIGTDLVGRDDIDFNLYPGGAATGSVVDALTLEPMAGARVELWAGSFLGFITLVDESTTNANGLFDLRHARPARHTVVIRPLQHIQQRWPGVNCFGDCLSSFASGFSIPENGSVDAGQFRVNLGAVVRGLARQPGYGAVQAVQLYDAGGQFVMSVGANRETGAYQFPAWLGGTFFLNSIYDDRCERFQNRACDSSSITTASPIQFQTPGATITADFALPSDGVARSGFE